MWTARVWTVCGAFACAAAWGGCRAPHAVPAAHQTNDARAAAARAPLAPQEYVIADPGGGYPLSLEALERAEDGSVRSAGVLVEGLRVVAGLHGARVAHDVVDPPFFDVKRVPRSLGGGFLFRNRSALYLAETFDAPLRPLVEMPAPIDAVAIGPKYALVTTSGGERRAIQIPSGTRVPIAPAGVVDIASVDRHAAALTDVGGALFSTDGGATWTDVTPLVHRPEHVEVVGDAPWIVSVGGEARRVDDDGSRFVDRLPARAPVVLRPRDPRWRARESPSRLALHAGAPLDDGTAVVASEGDVVRVNVRTGQLVSVTPGHLPPEAWCEALRAPDGRASFDEIVYVCRTEKGTSFVASQAGIDGDVTIERTFGASGRFYAGDDGGLAFGGPCARATMSRATACVRAARGAWREIDLGALRADAGAAGPIEVARWVPRLDGGLFALVTSPEPAVVDARTGAARVLRLDALSEPARLTLVDGLERSSRERIDRMWTALPSGGLRGWTATGTAADVAPDGTVALSPFSFPHALTAGRFAFAQTPEGRAWQSLDHGVTWSEVAPSPSSQHESQELERARERSAEPPFADSRRSALNEWVASSERGVCSAVGCDLGAWYRLGWVAAPPSPPPSLAVAPAPHRVTVAPAPAMTCHGAGKTRISSAPLTAASPSDLGLGVARLPVSQGARAFARVAFGRFAVTPPYGVRSALDAEQSYFGAARAVLHGPATASAMGAPFAVIGPNQSPFSLRRSLAFVAPFDVAGVVRRAFFGTSDALAAARTVGMTVDDALREDMTDLTAVAPVTPLDAAAPDELVVSSARGLVGVVHGEPPRLRAAFRRPTDDDASPVSAVRLGADDVAVLEVDARGQGAIFSIGAAGATDLSIVPAPPRADGYPANADALAIGPNGVLAVVRTPSGGEPPSALDPATLIVGRGAPIALAPWSTVKTADSADCRADQGGYRATIVARGSWIRLAGDVTLNDDAPMFARVRWTTHRVCLESIEVRVQDTPVPWRAPYDPGIETWLVARFAGAPAAARHAIIPGAELRQAMACAM